MKYSDPYIRQADVLNVIDGDTVDVIIDLGFYLAARKRVRLARINAPEMNTLEGKNARMFLRDALEQTTGPIYVRTYKDGEDKYGRYLADILLPEFTDSLNDHMVRSGHAAYKYYGSQLPQVADDSGI